MTEHIRLVVGREDGSDSSKKRATILSITEFAYEDPPSFTVRTPDHWIIDKFSMCQRGAIRHLNMFWNTCHFITVSHGKSEEHWTFQTGKVLLMNPSGIIMRSDMLAEGEITQGMETLAQVWDYLVRSKKL